MTLHACPYKQWSAAPGATHACECGSVWRAEPWGPLDIKWIRIGEVAEPPAS